MVDNPSLLPLSPPPRHSIIKATNDNEYILDITRLPTLYPHQFMTDNIASRRFHLPITDLYPGVEYLITVDHIEWMLRLDLTSINNECGVRVTIKCLPDMNNDMWSVIGAVRVRLVSLCPDKTKEFIIDDGFNWNGKEIGCNLCTFNELTTVANKYLDQTDMIRIETTIKVLKVDGLSNVSSVTRISEYVQYLPMCNFSIVCGGCRLLVNRTLISYLAPFLHNSITSTDIINEFVDVSNISNLPDMVEYLNVMLPTRKDITDLNVGIVLDKAFVFKSSDVIRRCEDHLIQYSLLDVNIKNNYAITYGLTRLYTTNTPNNPQ